MHPFACVKRLKEKPLREFAVPSCKQWLYVEQALNSSLLKQPPLFSMPESQFRRFAAPEGKESNIFNFLLKIFQHHGVPPI